MTEPSPRDEGAFYRYFTKILLVAAASALGGGAIRIGTDPLKDELVKVREDLRQMFQEHERRISKLESFLDLRK